MKRFGLSANERIKSRKDFEYIFSAGSSIYSADGKIKSIFVFEKADESAAGVKIAAASGKKFGSAVWRNRFRRLVKNTYRLNKEFLLGVCTEKKILLKIIFSPNKLNERNNKKLYQEDILPGVLFIIDKIKRKLE